MVYHAFSYDLEKALQDTFLSASKSEEDDVYDSVLELASAVIWDQRQLSDRDARRSRSNGNNR